MSPFPVFRSPTSVLCFLRPFRPGSHDVFRSAAYGKTAPQMPAMQFRSSLQVWKDKARKAALPVSFVRTAIRGFGKKRIEDKACVPGVRGEDAYIQERPRRDKVQMLGLPGMQDFQKAQDARVRIVALGRFRKNCARDLRSTHGFSEPCSLTNAVEGVRGIAGEAAAKRRKQEIAVKEAEFSGIFLMAIS